MGWGYRAVMDLDRVLEAFKAEAAFSGFVLDFDGTLSEIVPSPPDARLVRGADRVLERLVESYSVVAILSGRRAEEVARLVAVPGIHYYGLYGAERLLRNELVQPPEAAAYRGVASRIARDAEAMISAEGLHGCEVEFKDLTVSIHYRNAERQDAGLVISEWAEVVASRRRFSVGSGRMVVELKPPGISKSFTIEKIIRAASLSRILFAGDDSADLEAMRHLESLSYVDAVRVAVMSSEAPKELEAVSDFSTDSPAGLVGLLRGFLVAQDS